MRLKKESELLDQKVRTQIIDEILSTENQVRKADAFRRYQCYKDRTSSYVVGKLLAQFDSATVTEMGYALSNISFVRKVIDKLARVYKYGVERFVPDNETETEALQDTARELDFNSQMKKSNRFYKLFRNTLVMISPVRATLDDDEDKYTLEVRPLAPYLYDVVEHYEQREQAVCVVLSNYEPVSFSPISSAPTPISPGPVPVVVNPDGRKFIGAPMDGFGNGRDEIIADAPADQGKEDRREFKFWSKNYHFTCYANGDFVDETRDNPIGELPFVNLADDQDGSFWALGGDDLVEGAILCNALITHINHVGVTQGYGQIVMIGENLPRNIRVGPNKAVLLPFKGQEGEPQPSFAFHTANPPLQELRGLVEMYVALLLSTNNLSTSGVASQLNGTAGFASGIAMILDKAESMEDIEDQRQVFQDAEPEIWGIYSKWHQLYSDQKLLVDVLQAIPFPSDPNVVVRFADPAPIMSEQERLEVLKLRRDLGLDTMVDLIKRDNPHLTDAEADEHLKALLEEKMAAAQTAIQTMQGTATEGTPDGEGNDVSDESSDGIENRPGDSDDEPDAEG